MATYTIKAEKVSFNVKARTMQQATYKACDFLLQYPQLGTIGRLDIHSKRSFEFNPSLPFITMTSAGFKRRYKINPNTNKKVIAKLLAMV